MFKKSWIKSYIWKSNWKWSFKRICNKRCWFRNNSRISSRRTPRSRACWTIFSKIMMCWRSRIRNWSSRTFVCRRSCTSIRIYSNRVSWRESFRNRIVKILSFRFNSTKKKYYKCNRIIKVNIIIFFHFLRFRKLDSRKRKSESYYG